MMEVLPQCIGAPWCENMFSTLPLLLMLLATARCGKDSPVFSPEINEIIEVMHNECVGKSGVSEDDIWNCEKGIFKEDDKLKCYMFCMLEESSLVDDDQVDYDMWASLMPEPWHDKAKAMLEICKKQDVPGKTKCQLAFDINKCSYELDSDFYFIV